MGLFGAIGAALGGSKGRNSLSDFMKQITPKNNTAAGKPVDNSHSHSNDSSTQQRSGGRPEMQQPIPIVQPNNMANNNYTNSNTQRVGADLFKGEALANQTAQRRMTGSNPTPLPGEESGGMGDNQLEAPLMQQKLSKKQTVKNDPKLEKGTDASYGISGYVNTEKEYKQALQEKNHPNIYKSPVMQTDFPHSDPNKGRKYVVNKEKRGTSKDTLYLPKDAFVSKSGYVDDEEYEQLATKASKDGTYNYEGGAFDWRKLEDKGKVKFKN
jgi:hypothetical protein